jgi:tungstate transport system substrate-binding protein
MSFPVGRRAVCSAAAGLVIAWAVAACGGASGTATSSSSASAGAPSGRQLILATTTSTQDSGLLDVLVPAFEKASGYHVKTVAVGSGQALKMGQQGNADVLLVHSPAAEQTFMTGGFGSDRRLVAHNFFLVVGPHGDPAGIAGAPTAAAAFGKIAAAKAGFVSRGDGSGTETKELAIWAKAGITPKGLPWYLQSGQGMGATLQIASEKQAYALTDDATFLSSQAKLQLMSLSKGDPSLLNVYHVIVVSPAKFPKVNSAGATAFADYVTGAAGQAVITGFGREKFGRALFTGDAGKAEANL